MRDEIGELIRGNVVKLVEQRGLIERCGLCCVVMPTSSFSKEGVVCRNLTARDGIAICQIYASRPVACQKFDCGNCVNQVQGLENLVIDALGGRGNTVFYIETEEGYSDAQDTSQAIKDMERLGLLRFSPTALGLREDRELTGRVTPAIWALVRPGRIGESDLPGDAVMQYLGVDQFLRNVSLAGARGTIAFARTVIANGSSSPNGLWKPVESLVARGLALGNNAFESSNIGDLLYEAH